MYSYNKEMEDILLSELHNRYNTGISFLPGSVPPRLDADIPRDFSVNFEDSLIRLFALAASMLDGNCFPCMVNDTKDINAFAEKRHDIPIVGIHLPLVAECVCLAHAYSMFDDFFVMTRPTVRYDYEYRSPVINEAGGFRLERAQSESKRTLADMTAFLAVKYIIFHEVAHHHFNHLEKTKTGRLSAKSDGACVIDGVSLQELEIQADTWAAAKMLIDFVEIKENFAQYFSESINHLDTIKILYLSALIPLLTAYDKITPENILDVDHPPSIIRYNDVKEVFISVFGIEGGGSLNGEYWRLVKNEMLSEYEKHEWMKEDFIGTLEKMDVPWKGIDIMAKVRDDDAEYVRFFIMSWMNDVFAYITVRFAEMTGVGFRNTEQTYRGFIAKLNELSSEGIQPYKPFTMDVE